MKYQLSDFDCMSINEMPLEERPREKLETLGANALSDIELLCAVIGSGTKQHPVQELADTIFSRISLMNGDFTPKDLVGIPGLGKAKACSICASIELGRRLYPVKKRKASTPEEIFKTISHFGDREQEHLICVMLNGALEIMGVRVITVGLVNKSLVHPREVFKPAIEMNATAIVIAHNHPSGNLEPSPEDLEVTNKIQKAGNLLGIKLLDHLIFTGDNYYSIHEHGDVWF